MFVGHKLRQLRQRGDTIVEVLIAMTVASSVLAVSYATMNRNLLITQDSQERTEASKIAQGQIEILRSLKNSNPAGVPIAGVSFCLLQDGTPKPFVDSTYPKPTLIADDFTKYPVECVINFYHIGITTTDLKNYRFYIRWNRITGQDSDEVIMVYRI